MSVQVKRRRDTAANLASFIGAQAELLIDTTNNRVQVHDGATAGGWPAAKLAEVLTNRRTAVADANYSVQAADRTIAFTSLSAARNVALPLADAFPTGTALLVLDESGACSATNTITLARAGGDTIDGAISAVIASAHGYIALQSDGASKWTIIGQPTSAAGATRTAISDAAYTIVAADRLVAYTALTASRTLTLCAASAYPTGTILWIVDESGACSASDTINVNRTGSDTIDGATSTMLNAAYMALGLESNGANAWTIVAQGPNVAANLVGIGTAPDPTNPLSVHAANALFSGASDFRIKINKASSSDTASFLFQDGFSGRAEIGLTGDDSFHFKVSADGSTWHDSLDIAATSGLVTANFGMALAGATSGTTQIQASAAASGTLTLPAATDILVGRATVDTLTNKTIDASANIVSHLTTTMFASSIVDTDGTLTADSDTRFASQKAVKTYVDAHTGVVSSLSSAALEVVVASDVVAVFVYDTAKDSDGGTWRRKVAGTSWMNETPNTSTRGARQEFPSKALFVSRAASLTIYDLDDPICPMWMVFNCAVQNLIFTALSLTDVVALNGIVSVTGQYVSEIDFILDEGRISGGSGQDRYNGNIVQRNLTLGVSQISAAAIANNTTNSVAMEVLPLTSKNPLRCGLPNPTIAVATAGGVSIIRSDGLIANSYDASNYGHVVFDGSGNLWATAGGYTYLLPAATYLVQNFGAIYFNYSNAAIFNSAGTALASLGKSKISRGSSFGLEIVNWSQTETNPSASQELSGNAASLIANITTAFNTGYMAGSCVLVLAESIADTTSLTAASPLSTTFPNSSGWTASGSNVVIGGGHCAATGAVYNTDTQQTTIACVVGRSYVITAVMSSFTSGFCNIDIPGMTTVVGGMVAASTSVGHFTAQSTSVTLQVSGSGTWALSSLNIQLAATDRSPSGNNAIVNGTLTRAAVASGAELAAIFGWSTSNYLSVPHSGLFDNGTNDFDWAVSIVNASITGTQAYWCYGYAPGGSFSGAFFELYSSGSTLNFHINDGTNSQTISTTISASQNYCVRCARRGSRFELWSNGILAAFATITATGSISNSSASLYIGLQASLSDPVAAATGITFFKAAQYATSPDQIAATYAAEIPLFQLNAKCLLHGSGSVQALAFDADQNQLAVSQSSGGTDVFKGLQNISTQLSNSPLSGSNNHKGVAFSDGDLVIGTIAGVDAFLPAIALRENLTKGLPRKPYDPNHATFRGVTTNATPTIIGSFVIPEGKAYGLIVKAFGVSYGGAMVERVDYVIEGGAQRQVGGNVNVDATTRTIFEVTGSQDCSIAADTSDQLCTIVATGKATTIEQWVATVQLADIGLEPAA